MNILFITWDGPQVSYLQSLFLPIFAALRERGLRFHVLQFSWSGKSDILANAKACEAKGVSYRHVAIFRKPVGLGALLTVIYGVRHLRAALRDFGVDGIMPRSTLPAFMVLLALWPSRRQARPIIFDADGLPLDERVDFGGSSASSVSYRILRDVEAQSVRRAFVVLTRSQAASEILHARAGAGTPRHKFHVVGNGRDRQKFHPFDEVQRRAHRRSLGIAEDAPLVVYAGSIGAQYCPESMAEFFRRVLRMRPDARMLLLSRSHRVFASLISGDERLEKACVLLSSTPDEVPIQLASADLGIALRKKSFSMQGVAPIKVGEYLLCGVPVLGSSGIGDSAPLDESVGLTLPGLTDQQLDAAAGWFVRTVVPNRSRFRRDCRDAGAAFGLEAATESYWNAIKELPHS